MRQASGRFQNQRKPNGTKGTTSYIYVPDFQKAVQVFASRRESLVWRICDHLGRAGALLCLSARALWHISHLCGSHTPPLWLSQPVFTALTVRFPGLNEQHRLRLTPYDPAAHATKSAVSRLRTKLHRIQNPPHNEEPAGHRPVPCWHAGSSVFPTQEGFDCPI